MTVEQRGGEIPVLLAQGRTLPEAWEKSVQLVWEQGVELETEYDQGRDPASLDATVMVVVEEPLAEPRLHRAFPGGIEDLEKYRLEVVEGVHDHWIRPEEGKWTYTYHKRLVDYRVAEDIHEWERGPFAGVDQLAYVVDKLSRVPHSRRAQAITWMPTLDPKTDDPPCLQRLWFRILKDRDGVGRLNLNAHWRSRDAYKAAFMNMYALTDLQRLLAEEIGRRQGKAVLPGRYVDISDSYHIYGAYRTEIQDRFLRSLRERSFAERTWRSDDPRVQAGLRRGREQIAREKEACGR